MSFQIPLVKIGEIISATFVNFSSDVGEKKVTGINTDSRTVKPGEVFVALKGEKFDGHKFVEAALASGAIAAIVEHCAHIESSQLPILVVENTLKAYQKIGCWWRAQFTIPVIAVTGSFGKTTTKELIAAVLATQGNVLKTQLNYNNEIGVPKTLLELSTEHDFAVIEMAMRGPGQIAELTQIAQPTIGVITNVGTAHIGLLGSEEAIARAKCELLAEMSPNSIAILNADNSLLMETAATVWHGQTLTYGLEAGDLRGTLIDNQTLEVEGVRLPLPLVGRHNAQNYLAALAVAKVLHIDWTLLSQGLTVELPEGRAKRYQLDCDVLILDETYNAGLESMLAALRLLAETPGRRHIAVLGTMLELGERSLEFHQKVGAFARQLNLDALFILADAPEAEAMALGAAGLSYLQVYSSTSDYDKSQLIQSLKTFVKPGDRLLFKASHAVALDKVVEQFKQEFTYP
ncbi:MAG: UDP-N-acetylmuramoyl-tripeptide--D-alanyl-D-alanine ligase [Oscillatoriaceae bacterium SKW80]|nr:UDP-N-acetylmuramoyl-tripeptide--D-alanyl-D-alanine ligase [Oscillatoriaceae bacterium SKYG93]MCX8122352.1 UDP-N-acetylmuramoyl-tripeptide--D-alanyl-D-alanine ligase [Oscillatoriaceae bacterium SKW80]MDW8452460.1 UDP-N-acetylmuramoyl-tripeptide--D-alanyl-D-alanine ligase [Oscillatoriaceae cyanobacterium SKYGB_i_bin93]HIK27739.1 UDP-N-acetylmuramoyl-tripeptide--D-alanyl-D-alanine ligase [Oscillatoriaceae cyanobacterium M7585_C2015_266]